MGRPPAWSVGAWPRFVSLCLNQIIAAHGRLLQRKSSLAQWSENRFSAVMVRYLEQLCDEEDGPVWRPVRDRTVDASLADLLSGKGKADTAKKIDISIWCFGMRCGVAFDVEAKLLSDHLLRSRSAAELTAAYVQQGVMRFTKGRYGQRAPAGAMLGYLISGNAAHHAAQVAAEIQRAKVPCVRPFASARPPCCPSHYESEHPRNPHGTITLHHLLLQC